MKLGINQTIALESLAEHWTWPGGWIMRNTSTTVRVLDSLVRLGLATGKYDNLRGVVEAYRLTKAGEDLARATFKPAPWRRGLLRETKGDRT